MNAVIQSLMTHRSIRAFKSDKVDEAILEAILEAGMRAATGGHFQPYSFIAIDEPEILETLAPYKAPAAILAVVDHFRFQRCLELLGAKFPVDSPMNFLLAYWDAVIALQNVAVAAESMGLGTVYIGDILCKDLRETLDLPDEVFPAALVLIGHPAQDPDLRPRLPSEAVIHRNRYHRATEDQLRVFYQRYEEIFERQFSELTDEEREELESTGITNGVQKLCRDMAAFFEDVDADVLANLKRAGFDIEKWA
ncbi:nitroreductase family protein [Candidatus Bipolaricaulota bacterium]